MQRRLGFTALAMVLVASLGGIATAGAAPKAEPTAQVVGNVKMHEDGSATVKGHYICPEGDDWHLWVSAKQAEGGERDPALEAEGSGARAHAWLESHPTTYTCDGKWHTQKFTITNGGQGFGTLEKGEAWVQFCLIKGGSETEPPEFFLVDQRWAKVR